MVLHGEGEGEKGRIKVTAYIYQSLGKNTQCDVTTGSHRCVTLYNAS